MAKLAPTLRKNAAALAMLLFVTAFYSLLYFSSRAEKKAPSGETKKTERLSPEALKAKEEAFKKICKPSPRS